MMRAFKWMLWGLAGLFVLSFFIDPPPETVTVKPRVDVAPATAAPMTGWATSVSKPDIEARLAEIMSRPAVPEPWSEAALVRHAELRRLYQEFLGFRDRAEFRRYGFGQGGPYGAWLAALQRVNGDLDYARLLFDRCELFPDDLRRHARDWVSGKSGVQIRDDAAAWAACFGP